MADRWASGEAYEPYIGRWSRLVAPRFLDWLAVPAGRRWLDVGCGTGALSRAVLDRCDPAEVVGLDPSPDFVAWAAGHVHDPRARFAEGDAGRLPEGPFGVVVSGLVLNFVPDPAAAVTAMREAAPGGVVAAYVWDYAGRMDLLRLFWDAATDLDPAAAPLDEGVRFPLCQPAPLEALWQAAGLATVGTTAVEVTTEFADFDDLWTPFLGGQGPAPGYVRSLPDQRRAALRDRLREVVPVARDGSVRLEARAWAVRGCS